MGTAKTQTLQHPDTGGFAENDILNFDELGISVELGANFASITANSDTFSIKNEKFTTVQVGSNNDAAHASTLASEGASVTENRITFNVSDATSKGLGVSDSDLTSLGDAQRAINELDSAIAKVNDER